MHSLSGLLEPRSGPVDPGSCPLCAALRDRFSKYAGDVARLNATICAMQLHKDFGHPDESGARGQEASSSATADKHHQERGKETMEHKPSRTGSPAPVGDSMHTPRVKNKVIKADPNGNRADRREAAKQAKKKK